MDQLTKIMITYFLDLYESVPIIENFFSFTYIENKGAAWGFFSNSTFLITMIGVFFLLFLIWYINESKNLNGINTLSLGFILGGVTGNLIDRVLRGHVVDFFNFVILGYHYPIFNIADVLIVGGVFLFMVDFLLGSVKNVKGK